MSAASLAEVRNESDVSDKHVLEIQNNLSFFLLIPVTGSAATQAE